MGIATLTAHERNDVAKRIRREGFTPAVIYGFGYEEGRPVQFKSSKLLATIKKYGTNARVSVDFEGEEKHGAIKDVQLHPVTNEIRHIDIQVFNKDDVVRLTVPIYFTGADELMIKRLVVSTIMTEIEITGPASKIPQSFTIDLLDKVEEGLATVADLGITEADDLRLSAEFTDAIATIAEAEVEPEEETEETDEAQPEVIGEVTTEEE